MADHQSSQSSQRHPVRNRVPKQFPDYVDCSFSESEPSLLVPIPKRPDSNRRSRAGRGIRSRGGRNATTKRNSDGLAISNVANAERQKENFEGMTDPSSHLRAEYSQPNQSIYQNYGVQQNFNNLTLPPISESSVVQNSEKYVMCSFDPLVDPLVGGDDAQNLYDDDDTMLVATPRFPFRTNEELERQIGVQQSSQDIQQEKNQPDYHIEELDSAPARPHVPTKRVVRQETEEWSFDQHHTSTLDDCSGDGYWREESGNIEPIPESHGNPQQPPLRPVDQQQLPLRPVDQQQPPLRTVDQQPHMRPVDQQQLPMRPVDQQQPPLRTVDQQQPPMRPVNQQQPPMRPVDQQQPPLRTINPHQLPFRPVNPHQLPLRPVNPQQSPLRPVHPQPLHPRPPTIPSRPISHTATASRQRSAQPTLWSADVFQEYVKHSFEFVKVNLRETNRKIDLALEKRTDCLCNVLEADEVEHMFNLPLKSFEDISKIEDRLEDPAAMRNLKVLLLRLGGRATSKTVFSIMYKLFSLEMGAAYTWTGKSRKGEHKKVFSELKNIIAAIRGTLQANKKIPEEDKRNPEVDHSIKEWFRHCQEKIDRQEAARNDEEQETDEDY